MQSYAKIMKFCVVIRKFSKFGTRMLNLLLCSFVLKLKKYNKKRFIYIFILEKSKTIEKPL